MVRHTTDADDGTETNSLRTRTDLRALPKYARFWPGVADASDDDRMRRLVGHGWLTADGDHPMSPVDVSATATGNRLAGVVHYLTDDTDDGEPDDLDYVVDLMGMDDFVDAATAHPNSEGTARYLRMILALSNRVDEVRHHADHAFDHDGLFAPYFVAFDAERRTVQMRFESAATADAYVANYTDRVDAVQNAADPTHVHIRTATDDE